MNTSQDLHLGEEGGLPPVADMLPPATITETLAIEDIQDVPQYVQDALMGAYAAAAHD